MPPLTMRGRYLMREYWGDSDLFLKLTAEEREFYIGLWMLADDDGWLPRDVPGIASEVFHFMDRAPRERIATEMLAKLVRMGKVQSLRCCLHLPTVARYPRAGKKSTVHRSEHQTHSKGFDANTKRIRTNLNGIQTDLSPSPDVNPSLPDPTSRTGAPARGGAPSALGEVMASAGGFAATLVTGGKR